MKELKDKRKESMVFTLSIIRRKMEVKTKYQYTYFIYPYIVEEKKIAKHLEKLLNNRNCTLKLFNKDQDVDIYSYFLPKVRDYMFPSFEFNKNQTKKLNEFDNSMKATILSKYSCTIFNYNIEKDIQGKTEKEGIFFGIRDIRIVCFNTGICFLLIKTMLDENSTLGDLCNFNYKFRDINSSVNKLKDFEKIKIQTDAFQDVKGIKALIKDITGNNLGARNLNMDIDRFITYSYACVGQEDWNNETNEEIFNKEFYKYATIQSADNIAEYDEENLLQIEKSKYIKYSTIGMGTVLLTSDINIENYTKLPHKYENEYLYNYLYEIYKKIYLKKINSNLKINSNFEKNRRDFIDFSKAIWIEEVTNEEDGNALIEQWKMALKMKSIYAEVKQKYDIMYKNNNIEKILKSNRIVALILIALLLVNIINSIYVFFK